ncbi:MAG: sigma-70 family RNA polymerase sigma factor [Lentisphaeraceae bacterium]|nr:sigma-70 family RNA polymerase sigma factor [Lentisphaeraceae bacterium]
MAVVKDYTLSVDEEKSSGIRDVKYDWNTQKTLIQRAQDPDDDQAWDDFVKYYESFIVMVLGKSNISVSEEEDLVQNILLKVWKGLPKYEYRKEKAKFRTWLSTIIRNTIISHYNKSKGEDGKREKYSTTIDDISESSIEKVIEQEWYDYVVSLAMEKVQEAFSGRAIEVFRLSLQEKKANEISELLGITEDTVYSLRSRVKRRLKQEVSKLREMIEFK